LVKKAGFRVLLSADEIETTEFSKSLSAVWDRQRRWAILRRRLGGLCYGAELFMSPLPFAVAAILAARGAALVEALAAALYLAEIAIVAILFGRAGRPLSALDFLLLPIRDAGVAALFWAGLFGRRTRWRGRQLTVGPGTLIEPQTPDRRTYSVTSQLIQN
jgi:ceramide glucosyltransferase